MAKTKGLSFYKKKKKISKAHVLEACTWILGMLIAVFIAIVLDLFLGTMISVVGVSMEPTLYNGQKVFVNTFLYLITAPQRGDVIVFLPNGNENSHYYVKRVVAVSGDKVVIRDGILYVNDEESPWITEKLVEEGVAANEFTLGNGEFFCIGDNSGNSEDSRSANIGPVSEKDILGKVWFRAPCEELGMGFVK